MKRHVDILITQWALDSYLELKHTKQFSSADYERTIRPDVRLLREFPKPPKFASNKFWSPATVNGHALPSGFKMKWHNLGDRRVQLRLPVGLGFTGELAMTAVLLHAYIKTDRNSEARQLAKMRTRLELLIMRKYIVKGRLT
jgi:hypothetical protein